MAVVVIVVYCRKYIILSYGGEGDGRVGGGGVGGGRVGGGSSSGNGSGCGWLWLLFIVVDILFYCVKN